jgi:iron-sulfur cluster repair protein YtfE (RIC family)
MILQNSEVKAIILAEHEVVRGLLREIEVGLDTMVSEKKVGSALAGTLERFCDTFLKHVEHEEEILEPVISERDAWGLMRKERMAKEHKEQREEIRRLRTLTPQVSGSFVVDMRAFLQVMRNMMVEEERVFLNDKLMRDDIVVDDTVTS